MNTAEIEAAWAFERVGQALYGERWHSHLARDLGMTARHMHRLAAGTVPVSSGIKRELAEIVERRQAELGVLAALLR